MVVFSEIIYVQQGSTWPGCENLKSSEEYWEQPWASDQISGIRGPSLLSRSLGGCFVFFFLRTLHEFSVLVLTATSQGRHLSWGCSLHAEPETRMSLSLSRGKWSQEAGGREQGERGGDRETHFRVCEGSHCCGWTPQNIQGAHRMPPDLLSQAGEVNLPPCWATGPPGPFCFWLRVTLCVCEWAWVCVLSCVWPSVTPRIVACQAPLSTEFSRQEYWSGLLFPIPVRVSNGV